MERRGRVFRRWGAAMAVAAPLLLATACGSGGTDSAGEQTSAADKPALFASLPAEIQESGVIRNGADFTYPPLEYVEADGTTFTGVDYDLAEAIGEKLGVRIEHSNAAFGTLIPQLQAKRLDMVLSFATVTDERMEVVDFVEYSQSGTAMMVRKGNPENIKTLADLCGKSVGLQSGAVQVPIAEKASADCVAAGKPPIDIKQQGKDSEVQMLLRSGRIDVDLLDSPVAAYSASQGDEFEVVPGERYEVRPHGVMVLKGNDQLAEALKNAIDELMEDGTYKEILDKYHVPDIALDEAKISRAQG
ncbi:glutamine ABC transporter, glutamine-binding periplasmic protein [Mycolicibacterium phlei]|uniref:ABC transporter substrate-binding protein n=1 Tax=Mycolicibacterium phlei DSM 43239 = CCUG 21000 TaxID=1226750 RepID=A0A5N5UYM0_MYCPH|nr:ABC transporter substrate-binding protein [Mycolicibacterium phlei]VEG11998.1 glutamine ABC transporter, glutamine-binding periplasmic protein [Mycobacteroides chelonae]AMO63908.1 Cystine-binding periplasmic protein precursor [Mycolicibacterium phlei]KAB7754704.1 ABC transporter substrate-binding protein [Mycolicibacterium phlei DSM 43239 = CCUG 21000]KXW65348.1 ABC transporter substrate-binding protein [Mycolicibacterium phlei DSM 43239 = CCUG 21000]STZ22362.1 glutamine ABC transporter, gl